MYEVIEYYKEDGEQIIAIEISEGKFKDTVYSYGAVEFPDKNEPIMSFDYTLHTPAESTFSAETLEEFKKMIGDILIDILEESLKEQTTVFSGGV
tara:strand:- start:314 stop:598 length:285 start_codon:yes stop_codon:yes gene_type:complete